MARHPIFAVMDLPSLIRHHLDERAGRDRIRILFAVESGSRAWGFHSPDSDYDVRFCYVHEPEWYLSIEDRSDFIEFPKDEVLDIVGYDLRKLLKLSRASNAKIYEWIQSPVRYRADTAFLDALRDLAPGYYSPRSGMHHYLGLARNTFESYLQGEAVRLKKYFYALRPLFAARWIAERNECPPMEFAPLRTIVADPAIQQAVDHLLDLKSGVDEKYTMTPLELLQTFIATELKDLGEVARQLPARQTGVEPLNRLFRNTVGL